ncbi:MAG: hypothetical protein JRH07_19175, partial [Deltaproteobacteria bacterium]|nr:hypothetical protein [Deltaproteobacteria bacterium]
MRARMEERGLRPIPVYHPEDPEDYLRALLNDYDEVALGSLSSMTTPELIEYLQPILQRARRAKVALHGMGCTRNELFKRFPFYTLASSTWATGSQYGVAYLQRGTSILSKSDRASRRDLRALFLEAFGPEGFQDFLDGRGRILDQWNLLQWAKLGERLGRHWARKPPYWFQEEDRRVYNLALPCTCGQGNGSCRRHGLGAGGRVPPTPDPEDPSRLRTGPMLRAATLRSGKDTHVFAGQLFCDDCYLADRCRL